MTLEENINELEKILAALESDGVTVEEGIDLFEKGIAVTGECLAGLEITKGKITALKKQMGELIEQPLETDSI